MIMSILKCLNKEGTLEYIYDIILYQDFLNISRF